MIKYYQSSFNSPEFFFQFLIVIIGSFDLFPTKLLFVHWHHFLYRNDKDFIYWNGHNNSPTFEASTKSFCSNTPIVKWSSQIWHKLYDFVTWTCLINNCKTSEVLKAHNICQFCHQEFESSNYLSFQVFLHLQPSSYMHPKVENFLFKSILLQILTHI